MDLAKMKSRASLVAMALAAQAAAEVAAAAVAAAAVAAAAVVPPPQAFLVASQGSTKAPSAKRPWHRSKPVLLAAAVVVVMGAGAVVVALAE
jgi:hypothetical protein